MTNGGASSGDTGCQPRPAGRGVLLPAARAAKRLGIDPRTMRAWVDRGDIAGLVVGARYYVSRAAVDDICARMKTTAPT